MKKWVIGIILSLSVFFMIGISNAKALIRTNFGNYPDLPYQSNYYLIVDDLNDSSYNPRLVIGASACEYSKFFTDIPPYSMAVGYNNNFVISGSNCNLKAYQLLNGAWSLITNINAGSKLMLTSKQYNQVSVATTLDIVARTNTNNVVISAGTNIITDIFNVAFEQGEVIMSNYNNLSANLLSYYVEPISSDYIPEDYRFCYISTGGGFRDNPICFELTYNESGVTYNNQVYHYYYNLPLFYNINLGFIIYDNEDNVVQQNNVSAYLSSLSSLEGYTIYDFTNYEYANMSNINSGMFALSSDLVNNVDIYVVDISTGTKTNFFISSYYNDNDSYYDSVGNRWLSFNFNNASVYLEIVNKVNDITDFWSYVDNYHLYMYFPNSAFVHLSGNPNIEDNQDNPVNQQAYMDSNGDIHYVDNPVKSDFSDTTGFMSHFNSYFGQYTDSTGLTSIIIAPLNLISSLSNSTCQPLNVPLPYVNSYLTLPCMTQVYKFYFPLFYDMYEIVTYGFVSYHILVYMLYIIKKAKDPKNDEIEVMDL